LVMYIESVLITNSATLNTHGPRHDQPLFCLHTPFISFLLLLFLLGVVVDIRLFVLLP
jgi:hypothetical protein